MAATEKEREARFRIGVDLGGTKIECVVLGPDGAERWRKRIPVPRGDYAATLQAVANLVREAERAANVKCSVGIGTPGAISAASGLMKNCNSVWLNGTPFKSDVEAALGREVRLANDANCFALSEAVDGAARDARIVFGVILGTGVGGGIVIDGKVLKGCNSISGEWGHNPIPWPQAGDLPGPVCYCGNSGCIETFLSGPGLTDEYVRNRSPGNPDSPIEASDVFARAESGEHEALWCVERYLNRLARSLAHVINIVDPHVIVLGVGLSNVERIYREVPDLWSRYVFSDTVATRLLRHVHGDASGVRGAAWLW